LVTVLFADIKGSTELIEGLDPEDARTLLDPALHHMMAAVHRYEGTVNQIMGDGIMALFGAPIAHEDHALRACYSALAIQDAMGDFTADVRRTHGFEMHIRVGLNSGEVVVRAIDNDLHMDYSAVGQTTHLAARMEQLAIPGSIQLTLSTIKLVEGLIRTNSLGPMPIKGLTEPVEVFELIGTTTIRRRLQATATRGLTRFVEREAEFSALNQALERSKTGHGQIIAVVGEAGVGKSRLVYEFVQSSRTLGWQVLESASVSYGKAIPYFPVVDLLKRYVHVEEGNDSDALQAKVTQQIINLNEKLRDTIQPLLWLLDALPEDSSFLQLDPPQKRQLTLDALKRILLEESRVQPLLLIFEDLHWIDSATQALLDSLIESVPTARLLLLVNYRTEYHHTWANKTYYIQLRLDPFLPESADILLQNLIGKDPELDSLKQHLIERTEGNPFFLEESIRMLVEDRVLTGEPSAYRLAKDLPAIQVPGSVHAVLAARIDRLPPDEKGLLQTAAVVGTEVPFSLLSVVADLPEEVLLRGLTGLQAAEFLYETRLFPDQEYTFKHALTRDVAYESLLKERRKVLHARIVKALEQIYRNHLTDQVQQLAYHALRGQEWEKAAAYFHQAGNRASARSAYREALVCFEQALFALRHLPESRDNLVKAIDMRFDLRNVLHPLGDHGGILAHLRTAEAYAKSLGDERRLAWISLYMSNYFWWTGDQDQAVESGQRALTINESLNDITIQVQSNFRLGNAHLALGDYGRAQEFLMRNVTSLEGEQIRERFGLAGLASVISRTMLVWALAERGDFTEGITRGQEGVRIAEAADHPFSLVMAYFGVGFLSLRKGKLDEAIPVLERGLEICRNRDIPVFFAWMASTLGYALALSGRVAKALPLLEQAVEQVASLKIMFCHSLWTAWLSEAYLLAESIEEAFVFAKQALQLSHNHRERGNEAWVHRLLGEINSLNNLSEVEKTEANYHQALTIAEELGMRPLQAQCHIGLGSLHSRTGLPEQAVTELSKAIELCNDMGMVFWLARAEAALAQVEDIK
jgi:class 3 adenylate cyclase/tetratricopeptide (TPR) repeat protein